VIIVAIAHAERPSDPSRASHSTASEEERVRTHTQAEKEENYTLSERKRHQFRRLSCSRLDPAQGKKGLVRKHEGHFPRGARPGEEGFLGPRIAGKNRTTGRALKTQANIAGRWNLKKKEFRALRATYAAKGRMLPSSARSCTTFGDDQGEFKRKENIP